MRGLAALGTGLICAATATFAAAPASAFHTADSFVRTANRGGGSKILYDGSARFRGYDCTMCHRDAPGKISVSVTSDPPDLVAEGTYRPLQEYVFTVEMTGAQTGDEAPDNLFVAETIDDEQRPVGHFEEIELSSLQRVSGDVNVEGAAFGANDRATWSFVYHAPETDTGRISFHLAAVAGDGGVTAASGAPTDPFGDDVFVMSVRACEQFTTCDTAFAEPEEIDSPVAHGCSFVSAPRDAHAWWLVLALGGALATRRRR